MKQEKEAKQISLKDKLETAIKTGVLTKNSMKHPTYRVQVFVAHGYFEYEVNKVEQAMAHAQAIMSTGVYRRALDGESVEFHKVYKVKVKSNLRDLGSQYYDKFVRT